jgi:hypothetical protein
MRRRATWFLRIRLALRRNPRLVESRHPPVRERTTLRESRRGTATSAGDELSEEDAVFIYGGGQAGRRDGGGDLAVTVLAPVTAPLGCADGLDSE